MAFNWLSKFQQTMEKSDNYAEKTLAAYRLGMKAKGSIVGVKIVTNESCCHLAQALPANIHYHPDDAPHLPLANCPQGRQCPCVYRPVMSYESEA